MSDDIMTGGGALDARAVTIANLREWATRQPGSLARAARENYPVHGAVLATVAATLATAVTKALGPSAVSVTFAEGSPTWMESTWEPRPAPDDAAFELYDLVLSVFGAIDRPSLVHLELLPIQRFTRKREPAATVVMVLVRAPELHSVAVLFPVPREVRP